MFSLHNSGKSFFSISMTLALECRLLTPLNCTVLALLMNRDAVISILHIA